MTEDDKHALREFVEGVGIIVFVVGVFIGGLIFIGSVQNPPVEEQSTKVVGEYKGCDIIQWHYGPLAEYKYFLHCEKSND